jgi:hypothetical protein
MRQVFVETNWVVDFAAPAHHKSSAAVNLLQRARANELRLHLPLACLTEARHPLLTRFQPRQEANAIREFLKRAVEGKGVASIDAQATLRVLDQFELTLREELRMLPETLSALRSEPGLEIFPLTEKMLARCADLAFSDVPLKPYDQAILAAITVRADELLEAGEDDLCFCELDSDLRPWDRYGNRKPALAAIYEQARITVYPGFEMAAATGPTV